MNVKPSRIGGLRPLFEIYEHCAAHGVAMYGGGMGELGVGRSRSSCSRRCFIPTRRTTSRPSPFNLPEPPSGAAVEPAGPRLAAARLQDTPASSGTRRRPCRGSGARGRSPGRSPRRGP